MTVLVTGGAGYIGSHMVHALVDAGERVVVLDDLATGFDWAIAKGASLVIGDVGDRPCVAALIAEHRVDAIVHFAASTVVPDSVHDPLGYYHNNTVNSHALIESAVKGGVRHFIFPPEIASTESLERELSLVRGAAAGSLAGVFGPRSITWQVDREAAIFLGAGRALLLQLAFDSAEDAVVFLTTESRQR